MRGWGSPCTCAWLEFLAKVLHKGMCFGDHSQLAGRSTPCSVALTSSSRFSVEGFQVSTMLDLTSELREVFAKSLLGMADICQMATAVPASVEEANLWVSDVL